MKQRVSSISLIFVLILLIAPETRPVTLAFVGDLMLGRGVNQTTAGNDSGRIFAELRPYLQSADLAFGNLESPLSRGLPVEPDAYNLCAPAENAAILTAAGFDLLSTANNHRSDCLASISREREDPLRLTASVLAEHHIEAVEDGYTPVEVTVAGRRLAFLAADDISAAADVAALTAAVKAARNEGAFVIVSMHWGMEYQAGATARQRMLAKELALAGAGLIVGHHPHVIQPAECILDPVSGAPTLVLYSLGNALFDQHGLPDTRQGLLAWVRLSRSGGIQLVRVPFEILKTGAGYNLRPDEATQSGCSGTLADQGT